MRPPAKPGNLYAQDVWTQNPENRKPYNPDGKGRWPANVILDEPSAALLDAMSGESVSRIGKPRGSAVPGDGWGMTKTGAEYDDAGGPSRFFLTAPIDDPDAEHLRFLYTAKASRAERNAGLDGMPEQQAGALVKTHGDTRVGRVRSDGAVQHASNPTHANHHPTVKPLALMRWLVRLVTPANGTILDPFTGSGSTGCAAVLEGFDFIGIEQDAEYVEIARKRIAHWTPVAPPQLVLALELETAS